MQIERQDSGSIRLISGALALAFLIAAPPGALAQEQVGAIAGSVTDVTGARLGFAQVTIEGTRLGTISDANGAYRIEEVPAGTHTVVARLIGYRRGTASVTVAAGATATQNFALDLDQLDLETIVVTGTRTPERKLESSTAISTVNSQEIQARAPRSTADLLKVVPGFYVESSGGEVGGNLFARGLPADGSFRYVALMEDGMPVYSSTELFFVNADIFVRVDDNIDRLEAVRGGNSALFGSNAPGGVVNYISKTGGPEIGGTMGAQIGTGGLNRYDLNINGPLGPDWLFNIGGFYRFDDGVRDPDFPASTGGQIKANITRSFENGYFRLYGKYLNDRNIFFLPVPIQGEFDADGEIEGIDFVTGFEREGTLTSREGIDKRVPLPRNNGDLLLPLDDGQKQVGGSVMAEFGLTLPGEVEIQNKLRFMDIDHTWNAMVPFDLVDANELAQEFVDDTPGGAGFRLTCVEGGATFGAAGCPNPNGLALKAGEWHVAKPLSDVANQFQVTKRAIAGNTTHNLAVGSYFSHYTAGNTWFFNDILTNVVDRPNFLDLEVLDAGGSVIRQVTNNGFRRYLPFFVNGTSNATIAAFFGGDQIQINDRWRIDIGGRFEHDEFEQNVEETEAFDLGGPSDADGFIEADTLVNGVNFGTGEFERINVDFDEWAASLGINYSLNENVSLYARGSRGYKMPILDNFLFSGTDREAEGFPDEAEELWQAEGGVKVGTPKLGLSAVVYWLLIKDFPSQDARVDPVTGETEVVTVFVGEARTIGGELEVVAQPSPYFRINAIATVQDPELTDFVEVVDDVEEVRDGNRVRRIPRVLWDVTGTVMYEGFRLRAGWNFIGHRFSNNSNTIDLPEFGVVSAGASLNVGSGLTLTANVSNLLDSEGLTEGNPRLDESLGGLADIFLARPVLPRRLVLGLRKDF
ncbi:MAG: TonB-dependent receptor [Gemmatimonadota bacterium]